MAMLADDWIPPVRRTLERYDAALLRQVAGRLVKPRSQWPTAELLERSLETLSNAAVIDRRLETLDPISRRLLALMAHGGQPRWRVVTLMELLLTLGASAELQPLIDLLEAGLLYPELSERTTRLRNFEQWLGLGDFPGLVVYAPPTVTARLTADDLQLPDCPGMMAATGPVHEADGLEWPLRLAVAWQQVAATPLRRTQQGDFFKRDLDRLRTDPVLNAAPADGVMDVADAGLLAVEWALALGLVCDTAGELSAGAFPSTWEQGLPATLASLWSTFLQLQAWDAATGWCGPGASPNPSPAVALLSLLLLARLAEDGWADPVAIESWIRQRHPHYTGGRAGLVAPRSREGRDGAFLLGLALPLRLVQAARTAEGAWVVRLSPTGRWLLGLADQPPSAPAYAQTLTVQPNHEVIVYRQGLTPALIARLSRLATWKALGPACTMQLQPETIYRGLESGLTFETILQTLEQHGMRPVPPAVVDSIRTWADKRERLGVYPSATLFEFNRPEDLQEALARGLPAQRLSDRLALITDESAIDYRQFRLAATRDYALPPERCVEVQDDGVTLTVDLARSDLMLETELRRFADPLEPAPEGRREYRVSPASLARGRQGGMTPRAVEEWFLRRTGHGLTPAVRLILNSAAVPPLVLRRQLVIYVSTSEVADGLLQWPATRHLIDSRLGPTALVVSEENLPLLADELRALGLTLEEPPAS